ncbi:1-deoxy-D-xylulose-5-phosphate reductoisomerase [Mariniplasma anaerobium]|uniref:1-deoxy-D-xylulose 5-phosphate reductoisomerase n=1 Tax=Mariniplasma anaerobium TaxID=2735436 RepID=A0A7U9TIT7_9MOLU|nr:1-deoxy-D-xylulose-5-phosphate reductoisomerase [Mariniplasma anaerobium]BCR36522.1 1-deoxy-D-xylulose 5-phosphate reductoisomerase [Mariniplasma anaerobium]
MKNIYLLGSTGSIGTQSLDVLKKHKNDFKLIGCSLGSDESKNKNILSTFKPEIACLRFENQIKTYEKEFPMITFVSGDQGLIDLVRYPKQGLVINALSGSTGLIPTIEAIKTSKDIALANKETLVMAGDIVKEYLNKFNVKLFPIDSEHSALWQTIDHEDKLSIRKIVITASGGSFRDFTREELKNVTKKQALNHPNWEMGAKITIDSATMMNKGLEVIEAHHLFDLDYDAIETILHKESVVHGLTYFIDGTIKASLSVSDMRIPIAHALFYPKRVSYDKQLELTNLSFKPMDYQRFPLLKLAYEVGRKGGILPTVMNAANEAAVKLFLDEKINFLDIETIVFDYVAKTANIKMPTLEEIKEVNQNIQDEIIRKYEKR